MMGRAMSDHSGHSLPRAPILPRLQHCLTDCYKGKTDVVGAITRSH